MLRIVFGASALVLFATRVFACDGQTGKVIFEDKFTDDSGGWTFGEENHLVLKAPGATLFDTHHDSTARLPSADHTSAIAWEAIAPPPGYACSNI